MSEKNNKLKVLQVNAVLDMGSTGVITREIGEVLQKNGHTVYYAVAETCEEGKNIYKIGNCLDHKIHAFLCRIWGKQGYYSKRSTIKLLKWIDTIKPDIIHIHNLHSNYINFLYLFDFIKKREIKTVITLHDCWFFTGKCFHFLYAGCSKWEKQCGGCPRLHSEQNSFFFDRTINVLKDKHKYVGLNRQVTVVTVSEWLNKLVQKSVLKNRDIVTIYNGIDIDVFRPINICQADYGISEGKFVILGVANKWLAKENRETFEIIREELLEDEILVLIGCNEEQQKALSGNIQGVGMLKQKQMVEYYCLADVFVNVTRVDSFPTVNIEALSCGTPVVTYDSGGSSECIIHGENGYSVTYGDTAELVKCIRDIKYRGKKYYSANCRRIATERYEKNKCYSKYIDLYEVSNKCII